MPIRLKKLIGTLALVIFVTLYAFLAMVIGDRAIASKSTLIKVLYFGVAGIVWIVPAGFIIWWMERRPKS